MRRAIAIGVVLLIAGAAAADVLLKNEGTTIGPVSTVNCVGTGIDCTRTGSVATVTVNAMDGGYTGPVSGVGACPSNQWVNALVDGGPPTCAQPNFNQIAGTVTDSQLANNYSGVGSCTSGQVVTSVNDNAAPTCSNDNKGSYTFGGFSLKALAANKDFAQYMAENNGVAANLNFVITEVGSGTTGVVELYEVSSGTIKCTVNVTCTSAVGAVFFKDCNADVTPTITAGEKYRLRWNSTTTCTSNPSGNATFVAMET